MVTAATIAWCEAASWVKWANTYTRYRAGWAKANGEVLVLRQKNRQRPPRLGKELDWWYTVNGSGEVYCLRIAVGADNATHELKCQMKNRPLPHASKCARSWAFVFFCTQEVQNLMKSFLRQYFHPCRFEGNQTESRVEEFLDYIRLMSHPAATHCACAGNPLIEPGSGMKVRAKSGSTKIFLWCVALTGQCYR